MSRLLSISIDVVSAAVILIPLMLVVQIPEFKKTSNKKKLAAIIFALYLSAVFSAVGVTSINYLRFHLSVNFIPLAGIANFTEPLLNVILFIPVGFMLPVIWKQYRSFKSAVLFGFMLSLFIEIFQIFTFRSTDVNDLITNTLGSAIGYVIAVFINNRGLCKLYLKKNKQYKNEPVYICLTVFLVMLLISGFISSYVWGIILK